MSEIHPACAECAGACCENLLMPIDPSFMSSPVRKYLRTRGEFEGDYMIRLNCPCRYLTDEGQCGIYTSRPDVCRTAAVGGAGCRAAIKANRTIPQRKAISAHFTDRIDDDVSRIG